MKPALAVLVARIRADEFPTPFEYGAVLHEAGVGQAEARSMTMRYKEAISGRSSAEEEFMASLRAFSLGAT